MCEGIQCTYMYVQMGCSVMCALWSRACELRVASRSPASHLLPHMWRTEICAVGGSWSRITLPSLVILLKNRGEKRPPAPKNGQKRPAVFPAPRSAHTPPRGHGTARWPFSLPKSSHACPSQGNLLNGQNWLSRGEFRAPRKQRYRPLPGLFEQGTTACATGRPTCQAVSGGVNARATTMGATWRAPVVRWPGAEP